MNPIEFVEVGRTGNTVQNLSLTLTGILHGGLEVTQSSTGSIDLTAPNVLSERLTLDSTFLSGDSRVIGLGFEVTNDTAILNKQGHVICWRLPQSGLQDQELWQLDQDDPGDYLATTASTVRCVAPPRDNAEASLIPGSVAWRAEDGCYSVTTFANNNNCSGNVSYVQPLIALVDPVTGRTGEETLGVINTFPMLVPQPIATIPYPEGDINMRIYPVNKVCPINMNGASFSGLSNSTVLTVTWKVYIETFPSCADRVLQPLAKPSCGYDPVALEFLARANRDLPHAVIVGDNPDGEWWADVIDAVTAAGALVAGNFLGPAAAGGVMALGHMGSQALRTTAAEKRARKAERQKEQDRIKVLNARAPYNPRPKTNTLKQKGPKPPARPRKGTGSTTTSTKVSRRQRRR
jgi:hypothetical protein